MIASLLLAGLLLTGGSAGELSDKHKKWLEEEAPYIISSRELKEFKALEEDAEREAFIERFWRRRDPDPSTEINEFKEEHYRRIRYANERFSNEGRPGWKTQRGRVYIIHGPPDDVRHSIGRQMRAVVYNPTELLNPTGGPVPVVEVEVHTPDSETWTYYHLEGVRSFSSLFTVIFARMDPDALAQVEASIKRVPPTAGVALRAQRDQVIKGFVTRPGVYLRNDYRILYAGQDRFIDAEDFIRDVFQPFSSSVDRFLLNEAKADLERSSGENLEERLRRREKLQKLVESRVFFDSLPLEIGIGFLKFLKGRINIPLRARIDVPETSPAPKLELLAELLKGRRSVAVLTDELRGAKGKPLAGPVSYQSRLVAPPGAYRLRVMVADETNQRLGLWEQEVQVPDLSGEGFGASELVICDEVISDREFKRRKTRRSKQAALQASREALLTFDGNVFVPAVDHVFRRKQNLTALLEVYNPSLQSGEPQVRIRPSFRRPNAGRLDLQPRRLDYLTDESENTIIYAFTIPLRHLDPGSYEFDVEITDTPTGKVVRKSAPLRIR